MTFAQPFQDYELLDRVGAGAMGTVFKARHKRLNRIVALKVLKPSLARDERYVDRLRREARIVASLNHPYIVSGYDLGDEGGYHFFVMEFVEGKSLRQLLLEWGMIAEEYVRRVARQVAMALDHAYQRGVIHRDIKPGNILIDEAGNVKLTDMGLAKGPTDLTLTRDGATVGTPQYISPEQARNPHDVDVRSDLYSLGATLYHMATGEPPFHGDTMAQLILDVLHTVPKAPDEVNPALSAGLSLVIRKLLVKDLTARYQTPQELLDDLDRIDRSLAPQIDARRLSASTEPSSPWFGRALLAMVVALLLGVAWWIGRESIPPVVAGPSKQQFLEQLDATLLPLPPGARLQQLDAIVEAPPGAESGLAQRRRDAAAALDAAVEGVAEQMLGDGWSALSAWLRDPLEWPDRARFDRERLAPRLKQVAGVALNKLPPTRKLQELGRAVDQAIAARDAELVTRFAAYLATAVPSRAEDLLRGDDFRGAERQWQQALTNYFASVRLQPIERLPEEVRRKLQEKHLLARQEAAAGIDTAERKVAEQFAAEVTAVVQLYRERLRDGEAPAAVAQALQAYRRELEALWPVAGKFRAERDPWPAATRQLGELRAEIELAVAGTAAAGWEQRLDFAWRALCQGRAVDGLAALGADASDDAGFAARRARHQRALAAAAAVEAAVLGAIGRANTPPVAFPHVGSGATFELRVAPHGDGVMLSAQAIGQPARAARLTEFRFGDLVRRLRELGLDPFAGLPAASLSLGVAVLRLVGDDLDGFADAVQDLDAEDRRFVADEIAPRIRRLRELRPEASFDRETMLQNLLAARVAAQDGTGPLVALERELAAFQSRVPEAARTARENVELRRATTWWRLARRRQDLLAELDRSAPRGAAVEVHIRDERLDAEVGLGPAVLQRLVTEGWQRVDAGLQFAGAGRPWSQLASCRMQVRPGFDASVLRTRLTLDCVLPPAAVGARWYLVASRGVHVVLVVAANDGAYAATVDGDPGREENVQQAMQRALAGVLAGPPKVVVVPGVVHRLSLDVQATSSRTRAQVRVALDGVDLGPATAVELSPQQVPDGVFYPLQEIAVQQAKVQAFDL